MKSECSLQNEICLRFLCLPRETKAAFLFLRSTQSTFIPVPNTELVHKMSSPRNKAMLISTMYRRKVVTENIFATSFIFFFFSMVHFHCNIERCDRTECRSECEYWLVGRVIIELYRYGTEIRSL